MLARLSLSLLFAAPGMVPTGALQSRQEAGDSGPALVSHDPDSAEASLKSYVDGAGQLQEGGSMEYVSEESIVSAERLWEAETIQMHCGGQTHRPTDTKPPFAKRNNLTFIHIPRCAGTTIEDCSATDPDELGHWGHASTELRGLHKFPKAHPHDNPFVRACYKHHVPPSQLSEYYTADKETFCVTRNPYSRMISEFRYPITKEFGAVMKSGKCNAAPLNDFLLKKINLTLANRWVMDCHLLPQSAFVFSWDQDNLKVIPGERRCNHMLRQEHLQQDFNDLMKKFGYEYRLTDHRSATTHWDSNICDDLSVKDMSPEVLKLINNLMREDFEYLGYEMVGGL